jgi:hypothetical protein
MGWYLGWEGWKGVEGRVVQVAGILDQQMTSLVVPKYLHGTQSKKA